jgi:ectoine hydroxylase-related dioxygenase (phytanoyl-CoA dioxygenase family)
MGRLASLSFVRKAAPPRRAVTDDEKTQFTQDGVVCLRGALDPDVVAGLGPAVEQVLASGEAPDLSGLDPTPTVTDRPGFRAGVDHWRTNDEIALFVRDSPLPALAAAILDSDHIWFYEDSLLVKEPGTPSRTAFHSDAGYFHVSGEQVCTFWVPLDPVSEETGSVQFVRGSHRFGDDYQPNLFVTDEPIPDTAGSPVPDILGDPALRERLISFDLEPGDLTVHHYRTLHGAGGNASLDQRRRALSVRYCGDDTRYLTKPGVPMKPHHRSVADGDPLGGPDCPEVWPS